jgi:hypothetical protein
MNLSSTLLSKNFGYKNVVAFLCILSISIACSAASKTVYSKASPSVWTTGSHWSSTSGGGTCSCTPDESKDVIYVETNTSSAAGLAFGSQVNLTVRNNSTLTINGNTSFANGAVVVVEAGSTLVITGNLTNNNNSNQISINGSLSVSGNFSGGNGSTVTGTGSMAVAGTTSGAGTIFGFGTGCSNCTTGPSGSSPMPVEFIAVNAVPQNSGIEVTWSTAAEFNSDYFIIQRSQNGGSFTDVSKVKAAGNSSTVKTYSSIDEDPHRGISYYRLKQLDFDGKFMFSDIVAVNLNGADMIAVYPNPTLKGAQFNVCVQANAKDEVLIVVRDLQGKEYYSKVVIVSNDKEVLAIDPEGKLASGVYIVVATSNDNIYEKKIVIQ